MATVARPLRRRGVATIVAIACVTALPAHAQVVAPPVPLVVPGSRVRVEVARPAGDRQRRPLRHTGALVRIDADSIVLRAGADTIAVSRGDVRAAELHVGERRRDVVMAQSGAIGLGFGVLFGALYGFGSYEPCSRPDLPCSGRADEAMHSAVTFALPGLAVGLAMGSLQNRDRWQRLTLEHGLRVGMLRDGRLGLAVAF